MTITSSISLSGMQASQTLMQTSAHNIANLNTQNFTRQEVAQSMQSGGGARAQPVAAGGVGAAIETDMMQQLQAKNAFLANLSVFKTSNSMLGSLLDVTA